ncbi:cytochrome P450, partial [Metarhizium majus ARSEF 297]
MPLQDKLRLVQDDGFRLILTLSFLWILAKLLYAFTLSPLRSIPGPKVARITALRAIRNRLPKNVIRYALHDFHTYGDIYISKPDTITLSNPVHARAVLGALDSRKMDIYKSLSDPVMKNLVTFSEPRLASQRRRQIGPYLNSPSYLARMEQVVLQYGAVSMMQKWNEQLDSAASGDNDGDRDKRTLELNYRNDTQLATFNIMSALAFGRVDKATSDSSRVVDWIAATAVYIGISINFRILLRFPLSLLVRPWLRKHDDFVGYARESVRQRKELLDENPDDKTPADMLQAFIDAEDPDSKIKMSPLEVQAESVGMQLAGSETTSASLTWAFHLLTLYPDVLGRAVGQVRSRFGADHLISYTDCKQHLPYLEALVYETFRFAPITSGFMPRVCSKDMSFQGYRVPAGTHIAFNLMAMNNHPDVWDQPDRFLPERFLGNEDAKRNIFAFSYGPRSCIGRNLAWMEIMTILANVLNTFNIRLPEDAMYGPHNVDGNGTPVIMPSHCHIVFSPQRPDRDCRLLVSRRPPLREA